MNQNFTLGAPGPNRPVAAQIERTGRVTPAGNQRAPPDHPLTWPAAAHARVRRVRRLRHATRPAAAARCHQTIKPESLQGNPER
jgi:hypothetical protein